MRAVTRVSQRAYLHCVQTPDPCIAAMTAVVSGIKAEEELQNWKLTVSALFDDDAFRQQAFGWFVPERVKNDLTVVRENFELKEAFEADALVTNSMLDTSLRLPARQPNWSDSRAAQDRSTRCHCSPRACVGGAGLVSRRQAWQYTCLHPSITGRDHRNAWQRSLRLVDQHGGDSHRDIRWLPACYSPGCALCADVHMEPPGTCSAYAAACDVQHDSKGCAGAFDHRLDELRYRHKCCHCLFDCVLSDFVDHPPRPA